MFLDYGKLKKGATEAQRHRGQPELPGQFANEALSGDYPLQKNSGRVSFRSRTRRSSRAYRGDRRETPNGSARGSSLPLSLRNANCLAQVERSFVETAPDDCAPYG
jgi:hypothetical protein